MEPLLAWNTSSASRLRCSDHKAKMQKNDTGISTRRIELDFLRGVAILLALGWHFNNPSIGLPGLDVLLAPGHYAGWAGVDLFFVLSGYLIGGLILNELARTNSFSMKRFVTRRAFKIWPVLYCYIIILLVTRRYSAAEILPQTLLHVQNFFITPLSHLWSLAVEEHFYLLFSALAALTTTRWNKSREAMPYVLLSVMVLCLGGRILAYWLGVGNDAIQIQTQYRVDGLSCGILLAWVRMFKRPMYDQVARMKWLWLTLFVLGVSVVLLTQNIPALHATVCYTAAYLAGAALLLLVESPSNALSRLWPYRIVAWIGVYSYATYVFQFVFYRAVEGFWPKISGVPISALALLFVKYVGAIFCGVVVTKALELPMLRLRERFFPAPMTWRTT